jgi:hypothetical protein
MSLDKEAATIAMEYLAEDPASPSPECDLALPSTPKTAQDLLDWVLSDPLRNKNQRSNEAAAIKWLGKVDGTPLAAIPLDVRYLVDNRIKLIRQHKLLKKTRRSNIITLLNQVLRRAGILMVGARRGGVSDADAPYQKGLAIRKVGSDIYDVAAVHALFRGGRFAGAEIAQGYRYKLADGRVVRSCHAEDCPCGDPYRHRLHIQALALLDDMLNTASVTKTANVVTVLYGTMPAVPPTN